MKYKLRKTYSKDPDLALEQILQDRGVTDIKNFMHPTAECEIDPHKLVNIERAAECLLRHLRNNSDILFVVDCDADGYTSSALLINYLYILFPKFVEKNVIWGLHKKKEHGIDLDFMPENT